MENLPFDTEGIDIDEALLLQETYLALQAKFGIGISNTEQLTLNNFDLFNNNPYLSVAGILSVNHPITKCYLSFIKIKDAYVCSHKGQGVDWTQPPDHFEYQVWGSIISKKDFGRVLIRRETLTDKIVGLIHPIELEFKDDKPFSRKYYVVANDKDKAMLAMNWNFRNSIMEISDERTVIEIAGNVLVMGIDQTIDKEQTVLLTENLLKLASNC